MSDYRSKNLIIGTGPAAASGAAMHWIISVWRILVGASNWDRQIVREAPMYGAVKDTQRVRSNPQQSDPIQVGLDIE